MAILTLGRAIVGAAMAVMAGVMVRRATYGVYQPTGMQGKTVLITGGTTGLGLESAKRLAKAGAQLIITARSDEKGKRAVQAIQEYCADGPADDATSPKVSYKILQLDDLESTKAASKWEDLPPIDVLMLNAGIMALPTRQMTHLGVEKQFHTNHLGHFVFTASVEPFLKRNARIIVVSSTAHKVPMLWGGLDLDYSWKPTDKRYGPMKSYGMSKLANVYFASQLNAISGYTAVSLHPGEVHTDIAREWTSYEPLKKFLKDTVVPLATSIGAVLTVERGANTQVYLASTEDPIVGGAYYANMAQEKLYWFATNKTKGEELWKQSEEISGMKFSF